MVFLTRDMNFIIPAGGLTLKLGSDGVEAEPLRYQLNLQLLPFWLEIAILHVLEAQSAHEALIQACRSGSNEDKGEALRAEFIASMQAVIAGATVIEAFHAAVKRCIDVPPETLEAWRKSRNRHKQIAEVFRLAFRLSPEHIGKLQAGLGLVAKFRAWAVHPPAEPKEARYHATLGAATEWRYVAFQYENARNLVGDVLGLVSDLCKRPREDTEMLMKYCAQIRRRVEPLSERWNDQVPSYGKEISGVP